MKIKWRIIWAGIGVYAAIFGLYAWFAWCFASAGTAGGLFGDAFGALNAAFSGLGFFGVALAIYLQHLQLKIQQDELRLQREELVLTREQLARSAKAQEESEEALRSQLKVMTLSSRLSALSLLIKEKESHLIEFHKMPQISSYSIQRLEQHSETIRSRMSSGGQEPDDSCLRLDLVMLMGFRRDLADIFFDLNIKENSA